MIITNRGANNNCLAIFNNTAARANPAAAFFMQNVSVLSVLRGISNRRYSAFNRDKKMCAVALFNFSIIY